MRTDASFDPPQQVIGNLRFTRSGVYADYLLDGLPVTMRSLATHERAARLLRNLARNLPSGTELFGLVVPDDPHSILRSIVGPHAANRDWVGYCRLWEPVIAQPSPTSSARPEHRRYWMTIPVDAGRAGRTMTGQGQKLLDWVVGRDVDSDRSVARFAALANDVVSALPDEFNITPATPAQIRWHHRHNAFRGVLHEPMPTRGTGPDRLTAADFDRVAFDEGANAIHASRWPTFRPVVRIYSPDNSHRPASYQTVLTVDHFPATGLRFPRAHFLRALDNVDTPATIDWLQHLNIRTPDAALALNRTNAKNIKDQDRQRGALADDDDELPRKFQGTQAYSAELKSNPSEREIDGTVLIAVGAPIIAIVEDAVKQIRQELDSAAIAFGRWRGGNAALWKAFNPGSETSSPLNEFRNPTTAHRWSRFMPLISDRVGNATGSPLAANQTTMRPNVILHDPEGAARRNHNTGLAIVGDPGGGKTNRAKLSSIEVRLRGGNVTVFDPGKHAEWAQAYRNIPGTIVLDPTANDLSLDPLRVFPYSEAAAIAADHLLPLIGVEARSMMHVQFELALHPDTRAANGITSMRRLIEYLRALPGRNPHQDDLLARLESCAASRYTQALFDETRAPYSPADAPATIWLTRSLSLPDADDIADPQRYKDLKPQQLASMALYGLLVDLEQQHMFERRDQYSVLIFEECAELMAYTPGARTAHRITRQGRKHNTGIWLITQDFHDLEPMGDKFITQKWLFRVADHGLAAQTLAWAGIDPQLYPDVVQAYAEDTSPANTRETSEGDIEPGAVDPSRRGEGFMVDEFGRTARVRFFGAPTTQLAADLDSTPPQVA